MNFLKTNNIFLQLLDVTIKKEYNANKVRDHILLYQKDGTFMRFREAVKLRVGDGVFIKDSRTDFRVATIFEIEVEDKNVFVRCDDGFLYHHTAIFPMVSYS